MNNTTNFLTNMPDFDDLDLGDTIDAIEASDRELLRKLNNNLGWLNFHEKMALGLNAFHSIDTGHTQLVEIKPKHGQYSQNLADAIELLSGLSVGAKAQFAADILTNDWDFGGEEIEEIDEY